MRRRDGGEEINFQFENFNDLMTFVGVTRPLGGFATCEVAYPQPCADAQLFKDVVSLEYLFSPERVGEASTFHTCARFERRSGVQGLSVAGVDSEQ